MAASLPIRPNAIAAQARSSGSSFLPNSPCAFSTPSSSVDAGVAAQRAERLEHRHLLGEIRVARELALDRPPRSSASAGRCARAAIARTVATRTSRCESSMVRSSNCSAPGEPISPSACTAASAHLHVGIRRQLRQRRDGGRRAHRAGAPHRLARHVAVGRADEPHELRRVRHRESRRRVLEQHAKARRLRLRQPREHRRERADAQLIEQLVQILLVRAAATLRRATAGAARAARDRSARSRMRSSCAFCVRRDARRALGRLRRLAEQERGGLELAGREDVQHQRVEQRGDLLAHAGIALLLEDVEQHRDDVPPQVDRVLLRTSSRRYSISLSSRK